MLRMLFPFLFTWSSNISFMIQLKYLVLSEALPDISPLLPRLSTNVFIGARLSWCFIISFMSQIINLGIRFESFFLTIQVQFFSKFFGFHLQNVSRTWPLLMTCVATTLVQATPSLTWFAVIPFSQILFLTLFSPFLTQNP